MLTGSDSALCPAGCWAAHQAAADTRLWLLQLSGRATTVDNPHEVERTLPGSPMPSELRKPVTSPSLLQFFLLPSSQLICLTAGRCSSGQILLSPAAKTKLSSSMPPLNHLHISLYRARTYIACGTKLDSIA